MYYHVLKKIILLSFVINCYAASAQSVWDAQTYPDETGFKSRTKDVLSQIAKQDFGKISLAESKCPDTGLPVFTWAIKGEEIISPYTGTRYIQGPTGYFAPTMRDEKGRIKFFGGDPLKYDLPPATATLLLNSDDVRAKSFVGILGNINQQYHFAAVNWARFYPLLAKQMGPEWIKDFAEEVGKYTEFGKNVRGIPKGDPKKAGNLIGNPEEFMGGGGTENHKTMWRTSGLLYSQILPAGSLISSYPAPQAETILTRMLTEYLQRAFKVGNGEYDSNIYYPYSVNGFLNLYDFSPKPQTQLMAKVALDYYTATLGLKLIDGTIAGGQKRGYFNEQDKLNGMEELMWAWAGNTSFPAEASGDKITLHQATSSYRPNQVIYNILTKNVKLPFEAQIAHPDYHMTKRNVFQETFYCAKDYALGNVAMTMVDNPNQQTVWSLVAKGTNGPLQIGGGQPLRLNPTGHSPYTQTIQHKGTLLLMSSQTAPKPKGDLTTEQQQRYAHATDRLVDLQVPKKWTKANLAEFFKQAPQMAASWLFIPRKITTIKQEGDKIFIEANNTFIAVLPLTKKYSWLRPELDLLPDGEDKNVLNILRKYQVLMIQGNHSGFVIETADRSEYADLEAFKKAIKQKTKLSTDKLAINNSIEFVTLSGDKLDMQYESSGLRANGAINGLEIDYENWANGGVYNSPYVQVKDGLMKITDGRTGYEIDFRGQVPVFR